MKTLVIIDMQRGTTEGSYHHCNLKSDKEWQKRYNQTIKNIISHSKNYKKIIFLIHTEGFRNSSRTKIIQELKPILKNKNVIIQNKTQDNGFPFISKLLTKDVHICGMNTDACVIKTALNCNLFHNTSVIEECCYSVYSSINNPFGESFNEGHIKAIKKMKNKGINII